MNIRVNPAARKVTLTLNKTEETYLDRAVELAGRVVENLDGLRDDPSLATHGLAVDPAKVKELRSLALAMQHAVAGFRAASRELAG